MQIESEGYVLGDVVRYWTVDADGDEALAVATVAGFWDDDGRAMFVLADPGKDYDIDVTLREIEGRVEVPDLSTPEKVVDFLSA